MFSSRGKSLMLISTVLLVAACGHQAPKVTETTLNSATVSFEDSFRQYAMRCEEGTDPGRSMGTLKVTIYRVESAATGIAASRPVAATTDHRNGVIQNCWMADIYGDENAEILIFSTSVGSGSYGQLQVYKFDGTHLRHAELPDPMPDLMVGYMGHDWYELMDGILYRKFPLYLEDDANCCPRGGDKAIKFDRLSSTWKLSAN